MITALLALEKLVAWPVLRWRRIKSFLGNRGGRLTQEWVRASRSVSQTSRAPTLTGSLKILQRAIAARQNALVETLERGFSASPQKTTAPRQNYLCVSTYHAKAPTSVAACVFAARQKYAIRVPSLTAWPLRAHAMHCLLVPEQTA